MTSKDLLTSDDRIILEEINDKALDVFHESYLTKNPFPREASRIFIESQFKRTDISYAVKLELLYSSGSHGVHHSYWWGLSHLKKKDLIIYVQDLVVQPKHFPYIVEHSSFPLEGLRSIFYKCGYTKDENQKILFEKLVEAGYFTPEKLVKLASFLSETSLDVDRVANLLRVQLGLDQDIPSSWVIRFAGGS